MNTLLIDIGNSRVKWALARGPRIGRQHAVELGRFGEFGRWLGKRRDIDDVQAVSVAGKRVEAQLRTVLRRHAQPAPTFARSTRQAAGVTNGYRESWRLGADRWVASIGAWHEAGARRAVCAVAVGTALTIDVVDAAGFHRGGLIAPGPALMVRSLLDSTHGIAPRAAGRLRSRRPAGPGVIRPLADNTRDAIGLGSLAAAAALIDRSIAAVRRELGARPVVYLTGGAAAPIAPLLQSAFTDCPDLVLRGLAALARARREAGLIGLRA